MSHGSCSIIGPLPALSFKRLNPLVLVDNILYLAIVQLKKISDFKSLFNQFKIRTTFISNLAL